MLLGKKTFLPFKLRFFRNRRNHKFTLLDIGCGNHSPQITKYWFPECHYVGVDIDAMYGGNDANDAKAIDEFVQLDLTRDSLDSLPEADVIIMAHVIEHLPNGKGVLLRLCRKLKPGGEIFIETPAPRSLKFPHGRRTLNFHDDPTHVRIYRIEEIAGLLEASGLKILGSGTRRHPLKLWLTPAILVIELFSLVRYRELDGPLLWDLLGFASYVHGMRTC